MRLFKRHNGRDAVAVPTAPPDLDIAASRTGDRLFLHVANLAYARPTAATLAVDGHRITAGRVHEIAPTDLRLAANETRPDAFTPTEKPLPVTPAGTATWRFPRASVSAVELETA
jgi:gamma-glutamyltranspeptidase